MVFMDQVVHDGTRCSYRDPYSLCARGECVVGAPGGRMPNPLHLLPDTPLVVSLVILRCTKGYPPTHPVRRGNSKPALRPCRDPCLQGWGQMGASGGALKWGLRAGL